MFSDTDHKFMQRALQLAKLGMGRVSPNPMVGALLVSDGSIIGEGYHAQYGQAHAEVNAIKQVQDATLLRQATLYVTLEPCNHHGKTPPCTDLILASGIPRVVVATSDPNPKVSGKGIARLQQAGIEVVQGVCEAEARWLNRRFITAHEQQRAYIILKWAQSHNGLIATANKQPIWISNTYSRMLVHKWRTEEDAIMVGPGTLLHDNPRLTARDWPGKSPVRVSYSKRAGFSLRHDAYFGDNSSKSILFHTQPTGNIPACINQVYLDDDEAFFANIFSQLCEMGIHSVLVEGGKALLEYLLHHNLWDEARVFTAQRGLNTGIPAPVVQAVAHSIENIDGDHLHIYFNNSKSQL